MIIRRKLRARLVTKEEWAYIIKYGWKKPFTIVIAIGMLYGSIVAFHTGMYDRENYCCRQMSRDLEDFIEIFGVKVQIVTGRSDNGARHMWIRIAGLDIDSVSLLPGNSIALYYKTNITVYNDYYDFVKNEYTYSAFRDMQRRDQV